MVVGAEAILALRPALVVLCRACGQAGALEHLEYFLRIPSARRKTPHLVLLGATRAEAMQSPGLLRGAVLLFEYRVLGRGTRVFATEDTAGGRTVIAPAPARERVARLAVEALMRRGAEAVLLTHAWAETGEEAIFETATAPPIKGRWWTASRGREIPSYLPLLPTMDATLARMGQRSRSNLRYYRRRAERDLGACFVPVAAVSEGELRAFNRESSFPVTEEELHWRLQALRTVPGMSLCGVRDGEGQWLSLLAARRSQEVAMVEIDWQMNRADLPTSSLGTVMRAYFLEWEIAAGMERMYIEGGTPHAMRFSFVQERVCDLLVVRRGWLMRLRSYIPKAHRVLRRFVPQTNFVLRMLVDPELRWRRWP